MTVGMLLESILRKACCITAQIGNATPFDGTNYEDIADKLAAVEWIDMETKLCTTRVQGRQTIPP
jgi:DNA-directed RNA polymerase beta subunit